MTDLLFSQAPLTVPNLVFGSDAPVVPVDLSMQIAVLLDSTVTVSAVAGYDNRVTNWLDQRAAAAHQTALPHSDDAAAPWGMSIPQREAVAHPWQVAAPFARPVDVGFAVSRQATLRTGAPWQLAQRRAITLSIQARQALSNELRRTAVWQVAVKSGMHAALALQAGVFHDLSYSPQWTGAEPLVRDHTGRARASRQRVGVQGANAPWQVAGQARNGLSVMPPLFPPAPVIQFRDGHLVFECPPLSMPNLVFGVHACYLPPVAGVVVPFLRTYVTINSITLRRVDGNLPIPTHAFSMSLDADSWTWSWNASIPLAALPLVQPGSDGAPVEVEAMVNGVPYRLYAEGIASQRQFAQGRIAVKGRGLAALLDAPYASVTNHGNTAARTAQQLMLDVLTVNGVGFGWAVDWGMTDWLVPGNTWTHQGAYISAILNIAQAAGGYVQPHDTDQVLRILPRYPTAPWAWAIITPDFELPSAVVSVEGIDWTRKTGYDRVFVSGIQNGVLGQVSRAGTAGASVAPMVTDALITHAAAARQRGLSILSDTGRQARVTLTLPVLAETGLIKPGQFVRYQDGADSRLGLVRSTSLTWSRPKLRQTIAVETHA